MRVAVDFSAGAGQGAGIGRYARNVLPEAAAALPDWEFALWYAPEPGDGAAFVADASANFPGADRVTFHRSRLDRRRMDQLWFRARLPVPIQLWTGRVDLVYSPDFTAPPSMRRPSIPTIHDLAFLVTPERAPASLRDYLAVVVLRQVQRAAAVATVSETTKRDLIERLGVEPNRIVVIPNAADQRFFEATPLPPDVRAQLGLPDRYFLSVGTLEPRKNHRTLFAAMRQVPAADRIPLAVVGRRGWSSDEIVQEAEGLARDGLAILLDYVDDRLLPGIYAGATAVAYPSWYEGFGLPVLEGLAAGVPVVASNVPAHVEVAGDQAVLVDPADAEALAAALHTATDDRWRTRAMRDARRTRARRYSWQNAGTALAGLLRTVIDR